MEGFWSAHPRCARAVSQLVVERHVGGGSCGGGGGTSDVSCSGPASVVFGAAKLGR